MLDEGHAPFDALVMTDKLQAHQNALHILQRKGLPIPNPLPVGSPSPDQLHTDLTQTLDDLRVQHDKDLRLLYNCHASSYLSDMKHRYHSKDPIQNLGTVVCHSNDPLTVIPHPRLAPRLTPTRRHRSGS